MEPHIKVYIPHSEFQDSLIEYATYVLYKMKQIKNTDDEHPGMADNGKCQ